MKKAIQPAIVMALVGAFLSLGVVHGDDKKEKKEKKEPKTEKTETAISKEALEVMEKSGLDPELIEKLKEAMKSGGDSSVSVTTTVFGPDGKVVTTKKNGVTVKDGEEGVTSMTLDLGKLISEATANATAGAKAEAKSSGGSSKKSKEITATPSISGQVVIVDEDGKVHSQSMGAALDPEKLQKALAEALGSIDIKMDGLDDLFKQTEIFGFGPATIEGDDVSNRLDKIEKELDEQRKMLEKILEKL